jgi:hypothetical protein
MYPSRLLNLTILDGNIVTCRRSDDSVIETEDGRHKDTSVIANWMIQNPIITAKGSSDGQALKLEAAQAVVFP